MESVENPKKLLYLSLLLIGLVLIDKSIPKKKQEIVQQQKEESPVVEVVPSSEEIYENDIFASGETFQGIYFIKFYQVNQNSRSKLVKVQRKLKGNLKKRIKLALNQLKKGPSSDELEKGVLTSLPNKFTYNKKFKLIDGVLHISIDENFEKNASKELMQDRIDQLSFTLLEFKEIKGIKLYINETEIRELGKDKLSIPVVINKTSNRKVVFL